MYFLHLPPDQTKHYFTSLHHCRVIFFFLRRLLRQMSLSKQTSFDLKTRVITSLNKLSDRDTLSIATNELDSIAKTLSNDAFAPFLTCLSTIDSSDKLPLRRHCVRLLGLLSAAHGDALSPHLSKILSSVIRRLRDSDSSVRIACVDAVFCIASHITGPPFSSILKPLIECLSHEQDCNSQVGASLCLAAAIEAAPEHEGAELKKLLPKLLKLVKNEKFKAKPALISLIGSIAGVGGASGRNALTNLVPALVEFLSNEEWSARKAAAEALGKLAVAEGDSLSDLKLSCLASLENRRFDKVKVVRDSMNGAIELWKEVPGISDETESSSSCKDFVSNGCGFITPHSHKKNTKVKSSTESSSSTTSSKNSNALKSDHGKPKAARSCKMDLQKPFDLKVEAVPENPSSRIASEKYQNTHNPGFSDSEYGGNCRNPLLETEHSHSRTSVENFCAFGGARYRARVVPLSENQNQENILSTADSTAYDTIGNQEFENFSLIQKQIYQIENQQSTLLDLLQRFIGHSYKGMNYLESRVNGLEKVLDEISHDLAISTGVPGTGATGNGCCILPGADFLSPKFWRKTEEQNSSPKACFDNRFTSQNSYRGSNSSTPIDNHQTGSKVALKSTEFNDTSFTGVSGLHSPRRMWKTGQETRDLQMRYVHRLGRASLEP